MAKKNIKVKGGDMVLLGKRVGDSIFMPILCQTTLSLGRQLNTIDASSKCGKDIAIDEEDGTVTMEGFMIKAGVTDILTTKDLEDLYKTQDEADYIVGVADPVGKAGLVAYRFSGMITSKNLDMNNNEKGKSTITITTTTPVETGIILPSGAIMWDSDVKASGYTVDWSMFLGALNEDIPEAYQQEAELLLAPGINKVDRVAGIDKYGNLVPFLATRAGTATYVDKDGLLKTAPNGVCRIDYSTGKPLYLIESASTNFFKYSKSLTNTYWNYTGVTIQDNASLGRDGQMTASTITTVSGTPSYIYNLEGIAVTAGQSMTLSMWVKRGTKTSGYKIHIIDADNTSTTIIDSFDYSSQVNSDKYSKVEIPFVVPTGCSNVRVYLQRSGQGGDTDGNFYATDFQLEPMSAATSTIPTEGAIATRSSDGFQSQASDLYLFGAASFFQDVITVGTSNRNLYRSENIRFLYHINRTQSAFYDSVTSSQINAPVNGKYISAYGSGTKNIYQNGEKGNETTCDASVATTTGTIKCSYGSGNTAVMLGAMAVFSRKFTDQEAKDLTK